jgi:hypothetical protein
MLRRYYSSEVDISHANYQERLSAQQFLQRQVYPNQCQDSDHGIFFAESSLGDKKKFQCVDATAVAQRRLIVAGSVLARTNVASDEAAMQIQMK